MACTTYKSDDVIQTYLVQIHTELTIINGRRDKIRKAVQIKVGRGDGISASDSIIDSDDSAVAWNTDFPGNESTITAKSEKVEVGTEQIHISLFKR